MKATKALAEPLQPIVCKAASNSKILFEQMLVLMFGHKGRKSYTVCI